MTECRVQRKLAAIVAADVVGYSRLMSEDESGTLDALKSIRKELIDPAIAEYRGRIVKLMGDGALIEFPSVVDAVECSVEIQRAISVRNAGFPDSKSLIFRIGINLGDVIIDGDDIYGDGINVAARLEGIAVPGGVCISGTVFDHVRGKLDAGFEDLGLQKVKNIAEPVRVYRVAGSSINEVPDQVISKPKKPSIAILPFDNMSDSHDQEYFSDGISEDLTTALSQFEWLFVIARNSAFTYKGKAVDLKRVGRELGVRYVLEGSVRRAGDRVRINAQLIEAEGGGHIWAKKFDRKLEDVFELQDEIVASIAATVGPEITLAEIKRADAKRSNDLDAWDHYLRALAAYHRMTNDDVKAAVAELNQAIKIDPEFANAFALLGLCHAHIGMRGWIHPVTQAFEKSQRFAEKAIRLAPSSPDANLAMAFIRTVFGDASNAVGIAQHAIKLNPNSAAAYSILGHALLLSGDIEEGLAACKQAERISPRNSRGTWQFDTMGHAYFFLGNLERAIEVSKAGLNQDPSLFGAIVTLACAHAQLGNKIEAKQYVEELLRQIPGFSLRALRKNPMFTEPEMIDKLLVSMELAGLPE
jgi:TolB-like protein/class 3 adenylate cyclase/Tfp pilus assembly protein PilF